MLRKIIILNIIVLLSAPIGHTREIAGINLPDTSELSQSKLVLNGAGVRKKLFIKLYVGGLYLQQKDSDPEKIILADAPMAIKLHILSSMITSKKMEKATREGFQKSTGGNTTPIAKQIEKFIAVFKEKITENDTYDLNYTPDKGVEVYKNGTFHSLIEGLNFKQALFGIWLCDKPAQKKLKAGMLGL